MSSKKSNPRKSTRNNKKTKLCSSSTNTEVFVLPPDLLEKLGINLGNIESTQECPTGSGTNKEIETIYDGSCHTVSEEVTQIMLPKSNENQNESSFLETADLMKKSVFLSPTFLPVVTVIPEEAEFVGSKNFTDEKLILKYKTTSECNAKVNTSEERDNLIFFVHQEFESSTETNSIESKIDLLDHENTNVEIYNGNEKSTANPDDFIDEAYSTDGSNSNFEPFNSDSMQQAKPKQKINIISQEAPDSSQLKEIKNLFIPHKHTFIPVSMDTIITGKKLERSIVRNENDSDSFSKPETSRLSTDLQREILKTKSEDDLHITLMPFDIPADGKADRFIPSTDPTKNTEVFQIDQVSHTLGEDNMNDYIDANDSKIIKNVLETTVEHEKLSEKIEQKKPFERLVQVNGKDILENTTSSFTNKIHSENLLVRSETPFNPFLSYKNEVDVNINNNTYDVTNVQNYSVDSSITNDLGTMLRQHTCIDGNDQIYSIVKDNMDTKSTSVIYSPTLNTESVSTINEDKNNTFLTVIEMGKAEDNNLDIHSNDNFSEFSINCGASSNFLSNHIKENVVLGNPISEKLEALPNSDENKEVDCYVDININNNNIYDITNVQNNSVDLSITNDLGATTSQDTCTDVKDQIYSIVIDNRDSKNSFIIYPPTLKTVSVSTMKEDVNNTHLTIIEMENMADNNLDTSSNDNLSEFPMYCDASSNSPSNHIKRNGDVLGNHSSEKLNSLSNDDKNSELDCYVDININNNIYDAPNVQNYSVDLSITNDLGTMLSQHNCTERKDHIYSIVKDQHSENRAMENSSITYPQTLNTESVSTIKEDINNTILTVIEMEKTGADILNIRSNCSAFSNSLSNNVNSNADVLRSPISEKLKLLPNCDKNLDIPEDKVKEIAMYLKQLSYEQNKHKNRKILRPKRGKLNSKLRFQGVEKPGGHDQYEIKFDNINVHRKYERPSIRKLNTITSRSSVFKTPSIFSLSSAYINHDVEIDSVINMANTKIQEFCLCHDFGRLTCYDSEVLYEHLHFWWHTNVNYEIETLFDIYNDNEEYFDGHKNDFTHQENDDNSESDFHICWHVSKHGLGEYVDDDIEVENIPNRYDTYIYKNNEDFFDSPYGQESFPIDLLDTKCEIAEHDTNVDSDNNNTDTVSIGDNAGIEIVVEIKDKINEPLKNFAENLTPITDDKLEENVNTNTDLMNFTTDPNAVTTAVIFSKPIVVEITNDNVATIRKSNNDYNVEENERENIGVTDIAINANVNTSADTYSKQVAVAIMNDKITVRKPNSDDRFKENVNANTDVMNVIINQSTTTTANTSGVTVKTTSDNKLKNRKRKISSVGCPMESQNKKNVKCSVCKLVLADSEWEEHVSNVHCYVAWKEGHIMDFEDPDLLKNLKKEFKKKGLLKCTFCNVEIKYLKRFLPHVQKCLISKVLPGSVDEPAKADTLSSASEEQTKCGVCQQEVVLTRWIEHMSKEHQYLAWKDGEQPLDLQDENAIKEHLYNIVKDQGALTCAKCGLHRNYTRTSIKYYLDHIQTCGLDESRDVSSNAVEIAEVSTMEDCLTIKCAVCLDSIKSSEWFEHLSVKHDYLAWKDGEESPNLEDEDALKQHLLHISKEAGGLVCGKCGLNRKYPKTYLQHIKNCDVDISQVSIADDASCVDDSIVVLDEKVPKCAICHEVVVRSDWIDHIAKNHNYIAWKEGDTPLDLNDSDLIRRHLLNIVSKVGNLSCVKCGIERKYPKKYLEHVKVCTGQKVSGNDTTISLDCTIKSEVESEEIMAETTENSIVVTNVECAVCQEQMPSNQWISHSQEKHNYAAWRTDEPQLDINKEDVMFDHLKNIVKEFGNIICNECSRKFKYVKTYTQHVKHCTGGKEEVSKVKKYVHNSHVDTNDGFIVCGVCDKIMRLNRWMSHIQTDHNYLAWKDGQLALDLNNLDHIHSYLGALINKTKGLICSQCGKLHDDAASYLAHVKSCKGDAKYDPAAASSETLQLEKKGLYKCAICSENVRFEKWKSHAMNEHYNVAWVVGDEPIDIKSPYGAARNLKEYLSYAGKFVCKTCGITRVSGMGFYAHIIVCGKTEEEIDKYQNMCDICNSQYLCIYKSQHMTMHAQQELAKEQKIKAEINREKEIERKIDEQTPVYGRRKAAQKAQSVIEDYNKSSEYKYSCQSCTFGTDMEEQLTNHKCGKSSRRMSDAISMDQSESSDDDAIDFDEDTVDEDGPVRKKKRSDSRAPKLPFAVASNRQYLVEGFKDFSAHIYSSETLFPQWRICKYKSVPEDQVSDYLPSLEQSCKLFEFGEECTRFKRFEAKNERALAIFVGASVQCISWAPPHATENSTAHSYLAVAAHAGADSPRYGVDDLVEHAALIQIWDFGHFDIEPELALGLAHDYGTVWAMDWCPSGTRDCLPQNNSGEVARLGLLSVACSNGCGYIFSVPDPSTIRESDKLFHKLKPVVKLKLSMNSDRKIYQASSICWSKEKGHSIIIVGYANGSIAFYDLNTESPFLRTDEDDVTVLYPYHDERSHTTCITGLSMYPSVADDASCNAGVGALGAASSSGASAVLGAGAARVRARLATHTACIGAVFGPGWPGLMTAGDDAIMNQSSNELDYTGYGRRVGLLRASCGCERCGHIATHSGPYLRVLRMHPVYAEIKKQTVAVIKMKPLGKKRNYVNDEYAVKAEPLRYEDAVSRYGLYFSVIEKRKRTHTSSQHNKEICADRFPLADVPSMAFCPSDKYHSRLAIATYAGFVFVLNV